MSLSSIAAKRTGAPAFHSITLVVAVLAGLVTAGTVAVMLSASAMFLGWVAYGINSKTTAQGYANLICYVLGVGFGLVTTIVINWLTPSIGLTATGLAIFAVVVLVMCLRAGTPFNNPLAYFLGITSFFYSGLAPSFGAFATLTAAGAVGATGAAVSSYCQAGLLRRHSWVNSLSGSGERYGPDSRRIAMCPSAVAKCVLPTPTGPRMIADWAASRNPQRGQVTEQGAVIAQVLLCGPGVEMHGPGRGRLWPLGAIHRVSRGVMVGVERRHPAVAQVVTEVGDVAAEDDSAGHRQSHQQ